MNKLKKDKKWFITFIILLLAMLINNAYLILNIKGLYSIENVLRLTICIIIGLISVLMIALGIKALLKRNKLFYIILIIINLILIGGIGFININFNVIYSKLNKVTTNYTTYSISLVTTTNNSANSITDIDDSDIGIINDRDIANGYTFGEKIIKEKKLSNSLKEYTSYIEIIDDLINGNISYAFLPSNYIESFSSITGYEKIDDELKTIYEETGEEEQKSTNKDITEPFTILLMGVDGTGDDISKMTANGDSLMLVTFNPDTLSATMVSIPRDSYVPITCMSNKKNKITHSSWGGESCIVSTIENYTGINIDYYVKINFNGIVSLVNALGGIDVDVEYSFCEQNSNREWGSNTVYVKEGLQTLNGEQALAYARNRHANPEYCSSEWTNYSSNDFVRGTHQQEIVKAILSKIKNINSLDTFYDVLDTISNNMETNMEKNTILSFYSIVKDIAKKANNSDDTIDNIINIQKLYLSGYDANIYDFSQITNSGSKMVLYDFVPYKGSLEDIVEAMKINLELENEKVIKTFSYDISNPYEETIIGKGKYNESSITLLPNFVGKTKEYVQTYATKYGIKLTIEYVSNSGKTSDTVISQDPPAKMDIEAMSSTKGLTIKVAQGTTAFNYSSCTTEEYANDSNCQFSDFTGKTLTTFETWIKKFTALKANVSYTAIKNDDSSYDETKAGLIKSITADGEELTSGSIYKYKDAKIVVTYYGDKATSNNTGNSESASGTTET